MPVTPASPEETVVPAESVTQLRPVAGRKAAPGMRAAGPVAGAPRARALAAAGQDAAPNAAPHPGPGTVGRPALLMRQRRAAEEERLAREADAAAAPAPETAGTPSARPEPARTGGAEARAPDAPAEAPKRAPARAPVPKPAATPAKPLREDPFANYVPAPTVKSARMRQRHWGLVAAFMLMVALPAAVTAWYMYTRAADQYESDIGFGSRTEDAPSTFSFLGSLGGLGGSSSGDMDILYQFIASQELVSRVDKKVDLRALYSKPTNDPLLSFPRDGTIEDLVSYWSKMVVPSYDPSTGLMTVKVYAFDPQDAQKIASVVLDESASIINELSVTAQQDATRYGKEALDKAQSDMMAAQKALTSYRIKNNIVDPTDQLAGAGLVVNSLIQQLASAEVDLDMLNGTVPDNDPRIALLNRRIDVIQKRIDEEKSKVGGLSDTKAPGYANLVADYQSLQMASDFAQKAYLTALGAYDQAVNDAQHKTRYLATFVSPTLAQSSEAPNRPLWIFMVGLIGFLIWASLSMIYYALRDRR
ncbi:sugar transporter [bacterium]|nr:sugar transporter [bacterium]